MENILNRFSVSGKKALVVCPENPYGTEITRGLMEAGAEVRINAVCPGGLRSDRTNPLFAETYSRHTQLGRLAELDDIKGPIAFLVSDASAYLTGLSIPVDGGYTCI